MWIVTWRTWLTVVLAAVVFVADLYIPLGFSTSILYLTLLLLTLGEPTRQLTWLIAVLATVLTLAGHVLSPAAETSNQIYYSLTSRSMTIVSLWAMAALADQRKRLEQQLRATNRSLDSNVLQRTQELANTIESLKVEAQRRETVQNALEEQTQLLESLMDAIPDDIYFKDREGKYLRINKAKAERSGLENPQAAIGKTDADFFQPEHARAAHELEQRIMETGQPAVNIEEQLVWPDGHVTWMSATKVPLKNNRGEIIGTLGISRDITETHRMRASLEQERDRLRTLIDNLPDYIFIKDKDCRLIVINRALVEMLGCESEEEIIGRTDYEFMSKELADFYHEDDLRVLRTGESLVNREEELSTDRGHRWLLTTKVPLRSSDGEKVVGLVGICRDITQRKRAEEELRAAKEAADAANRAKSEFLANMSHEIRTPMNAIFGMTDLVLDTELTREQRDYLETVKDSAEALMGVINDILDFSKIEAGKIELDQTPFELREILGDTMKALGVRAHSKGIELVCHIDPQTPDWVVGDALRLRQVIVNLVGNAIKFTEQGEVVLDVKPLPTEDGCVRLAFCVTDTGIGMSDDQRQRIFEAFEQADMSTTRRFGGTGLGLTISSRLVSLMGGSLSVESQPGQGSRFFFEASFQEVTEDIVPKQPADSNRLQGLRVLIVDDNETNRTILLEMCRNWGMQPEAVSNAARALELLKTSADSGSAFDLVLTDASMPETDGFQLAEQIQSDESIASTMVMMITSLDGMGDTQRCEQLGIRSYLLKPVKQSELFDAIALAIGITESDGARAAQAVTPMQLPPLKILLAEDSLANQKLAVGLLTRWGHQVDIAHNGREAVRAVKDRHKEYDVVLMDIQMPELDGLEATRQIRGWERTQAKSIPIIAMTAHAMKGDRERCVEAGMNGYVSKPVRAEQLYRTLCEFFDPVENDADQEIPEPASDAETATGDSLIDWEVARKSTFGEEDLLQEVLEAFLEELPRLLTSLEQSLSTEDMHESRRFAHTIKGNLRTLGAAPVDMAQELETACAESRGEDARALLSTLRPDLIRVEKEITAFLGSSGSRASAS